MTVLPSVLGLEPEDAIERLKAAGFNDAVVRFSGRRREGNPRVIRIRLVSGNPELIVSCFKELDLGVRAEVDR